MRKWIMVVDDDLDMHYIYQKVFEKFGLGKSIRLFENGQDALDFLVMNADQVRIIFSDINMPVMDGLQLRSCINEDTTLNCRAIPFIFISTSAQEKDVKAAYDLMVQGFFQKGLTIREIEESVRTVLEYWGKCRLPQVVENCF